MLFSFGRDCNINFKHGINALPEHEQDGKGRISIILWGLAPHCVEEDGSPPMLDDNTRGAGYSMHASSSSYGNQQGGRDHRGQGNNAHEGGDVCRDFKKGNCSRGEKCRFAH